jgi:hypothetical protein
MSQQFALHVWAVARLGSTYATKDDPCIIFELLIEN